MMPNADQSYSRFSRELGGLISREPEAGLRPSERALRERALELNSGSNLATPAAQRRLYGEKRWYQQFVRLESVVNQYGIRKAREIWRSMPPSVFKRFQELFCYPDDRIVPRFDMRNGRIRFSTNLRKERVPLLAVMVDPRRIPEKLSEDLGLASFVKGTNSTAENLARKLDIAFLTRFKLFWEAAAPLERGHHRILVVGDIPEGCRQRYPEWAGVDAEPFRGHLLVAHETGSRGYGSRGRRSLYDRQFTVALYSDAHAALRRVEHIGGQYREEMERLNSLSVDLSMMQDALKSGYTRDLSRAEKDAQVAKAGVLIGTAVRELRGCIDRHKVRARGLLARARGFEDALERRNVGAALMQVGAAVREMQYRLADTRSKGGYIARDGVVLEHEIDRSANRLRAYGDRILKAAGLVGSRPGVFDAAQSKEARSAQAKGFLRRIALSPRTLEPIRISPYILFKEKLTEKYSQLVRAVSSGSLDETKERLVEMHIVRKFHEVYETLRRMESIAMVREKALREDDGVSPQTVIRELGERITRLLDLYNPRQILRDYNVRDEYRQPFYSLQKGLCDIHRGLRHYYNRELGTREAAEMLERFRAFLERFDVVSIVKGLP